jgi:hypothetical protein
LEAAQSGPTSAAPDDRGRLAAIVFAVVLVAAVPIILYQGRTQWFFLDEFDFLSARRATSFGDLMRPHNEHWSTVPIIVYRVLFHVVGLRHYWPYQLTLVLLHLTVAALLWTVMRRARVQPWIAVAAASLFALFGTGRQNIEFAFQIGFTGSLAFGLAFLLCTDHDDGLSRRDALGLVFGALSLMSSGVGVVMVVAVGIATLIRRGRRTAVALAAPLGALYVLWYATYGRKGNGNTHPALGSVATFSRVAIVNVFERLGRVPGMGFVLAAVVVVGVALALVDRSSRDLRRDAATIGLAFAAVAFALTTAYGRSGVSLPGVQGDPRASRYAHVLAALLLPLIALSAAQIARRWRPFAVVAVAVFLVGVPGNVRALRPTGTDRFTLGDPDLIVALAQSPQARKVPRDFEPMAFLAGGMTEGWLLDTQAAGRLPKRRSIPRSVEASATLLLSLRQERARPDGACRPAARHSADALRTGQEVVLPDGFSTIRAAGSGPDTGTASYLVNADLGRVLRVQLGPLDLDIEPASPGTAKVCG